MHVNSIQNRPDGRQAASGRLFVVLFFVDTWLCRFHRRMLRILPGNSLAFLGERWAAATSLRRG